jgi:hypothetical protein
MLAQKGSPKGSVSQSLVRKPFLVREIFSFGPQEKKIYTFNQKECHLLHQNLNLWSEELL